jgi:hypothetical protein
MLSRADSENSTATPAPESPHRDALYLPTDVTPEEVFQAIGRLRKEARDEINRLIGFLDKTDDYVSRELEDDHSANLEDGGDTEPCLGSLDHMTNQTRWAEGGTKDAEDEHDGSEPDNDGEPSLGAFEGHLDQNVSYTVSDAGIAFIHDAELDGAESGIGDQDGLMEQVGTQDWQQGRMG